MTQRWYIRLSGFFTIHYWLKGFLDCSLCCFIPLLWADSQKSFREFYSWLEDIRVYAFLGYMAVNICAQSSCFQRCLYYRQEMVHCTIYACIDINEQSSYSLALMLQVKAFNILGNYRLWRHHFTQCVWPDYWSWILSLPSFIMNSTNDINYSCHIQAVELV